MPDQSVIIGDFDPETIADQLSGQYRSKHISVRGDPDPDRAWIISVRPVYGSISGKSWTLKVKAKGYHPSAMDPDEAWNAILGTTDWREVARIQFDPVVGGWRAAPENIEDGSAEIARDVMAWLGKTYNPLATADTPKPLMNGDSNRSPRGRKRIFSTDPYFEKCLRNALETLNAQGDPTTGEGVADYWTDHLPYYRQRRRVGKPTTCTSDQVYQWCLDYLKKPFSDAAREMLPPR